MNTKIEEEITLSADDDAARAAWARYIAAEAAYTDAYNIYKAAETAYNDAEAEAVAAYDNAIRYGRHTAG